jgi:hypothetical protein
MMQEKPENDHESAHEAFRKYIRERQLQGKYPPLLSFFL